MSIRLQKQVMRLEQAAQYARDAAAGLDAKTAAARAGISPGAMRQWRRRNLPTDEFVRTVTEAQAV